MDTDVFLLCPVCKIITEGIGSGDLTDSIQCQKCKNDFIAKSSIRYKKCNFDEEGFVSHNGKRLYIPVELAIC